MVTRKTRHGGAAVASCAYRAAQPTARFGPAGVQSAMDDLGRYASLRPACPCDVAACAAELIHVHAMTARAACDYMTTQTLEVLHESVKRASCLPTRPEWERKAAAHAELLRLLADLAGRPTSGKYGAQARLILDWMRVVGPAANGMITSSYERLLAHLRAGDGDSAALEMETHLRALHYMWRLAHRGR
jgi:DNA-binding FadR family transcriptional regulator